MMQKKINEMRNNRIAALEVENRKLKRKVVKVEAKTDMLTETNERLEKHLHSKFDISTFSKFH